VGISFGSAGRGVAFSEEGTEFNLNLGHCKGGRNLKCLSGLHEVGRFIKSGTHVLKMLKPWNGA